MPLGLLSLAANVKINRNPVKIYQPGIRLIKKADYKKAAKDVLKNKPGLIGFSTWCITYPASLLVAKEIKILAPEIPIVFGGPQASILSKKTLEEFPFIDFILSGEADFTFPQFLNEYAKQLRDFSVIPGLSYRNNSGKIQINRMNGAISKLDELPIPAYDLVPEIKWIKLDVGRGCPFKCTYCSTNNFFSKKYRVKSSGRIISEMMYAFETKKIKSFSFAHDMFTLKKAFIFELCNKLISLKKEKGIAFSWTCSARIDCVNNKMLLSMKEAGCQDIFFGIESGSERVQKRIKKNLNLSKVYEVSDCCRTIGLNMHASFIIGFPEETQNDIDKTLHCALQLAINGTLTQISELSLLPGTPIYNNHHSKLIFDGRFSSFSQNLCGHEELNLINKYPKIFSSFYHLPVKAVSKSEMYFLSQFINHSKLFKNTLFQLSGFIKEEVKDLNLLQLFKTEYHRLTSDEINNKTIVSHWIRIIQNLIQKTNAHLEKRFLSDIFAFEAYTALLKTLYNTWQLVQTKTTYRKLQDNFTIRPTPIWKTLTTLYKLESILPSENGWKENRKRIKKGKYNYLLVATSEVNCKKIRLSEKEIVLLEHLSELSFLNYVKRVKSILNKKEIRLWIIKMRRLGVIETAGL